MSGKKIIITGVMLSILILPSVSSLAFAQYIPSSGYAGLEDYLKLSEDRVRIANENAVNIFSLDDEKMKILAKVISNKSSISILNLLFDDEMTANEIAQKTNMSLQLVKHYLEKMQQIELVCVSKIEKNSRPVT